MAKFCMKCGAALAEGAKFCTKCGAPIAQPQPADPKAASPAAQPAAAEPQAAPKPKPFLPRKQKQQPACAPVPAPAAGPEAPAEPRAFTFNASEKLGETVLGTLGENVSEAASAAVPGPFRLLGRSVKTLVASVVSVFKTPKKLIPALVLAVVWLVLNILQACGVESRFTDILSFVTFAKGGMSGGIPGVIGGILGKGLVAGAVTKLVGLFSRKRSGEKRSLIQTLAGSFGVSADSLWPYLTGAGAAMLIYLFISGGDVRSAFTAGLACTALSAGAALNDGFVRQALSSFVRKSKTDQSEKISGLIRGGTAGFAAAAFIGLSGIRLILIILGALLFAGGIVMMILARAGVVKPGKEAAAK